MSHLPPRSANRPWWFVLGREPLLSIAELLAGLAKNKPFNFSRSILKFSAPQLAPAKIIAKLGGTVKIGQEIAPNLRTEELLAVLSHNLCQLQAKIVFGFSGYDTGGAVTPQLLKSWGQKIKHRLAACGRSARYIFKDELVLSSATVAANKLASQGREFLILSGTPLPDGASTYNVAITQAVQPFLDWSHRDYGRPGRDDISGTLPPKLALMMVNLAALRHSSFDIHHSSFTIFDPFCGSGTILSEALLLGYYNLIGSDLSDKAVADSKKNIEWILQHTPNLQFPISNFRLFQSDVRDLARKLSIHSVDAIVTEPSLGPPLTGRETGGQIRKNMAELSQLYLTAFREFKHILKPNGTVVFIIPRFFANGKWLTLSDQIIPKIKKLGFVSELLLPKEISSEPFLLYHRPGQLVRREVWRFKSP